MIRFKGRSKAVQSRGDNSSHCSVSVNNTKRSGRTVSSSVPPEAIETESEYDTEPSTDSDGSGDSKSSGDSGRAQERAHSKKNLKQRNMQLHDSTRISDEVSTPKSPLDSRNNLPIKRPAVVNPFANKGEVYLGYDMALLADAMKLDLNTQVMLAYYDARSLEDFCLMTESDLKELLASARAMRRALPPLQVRKIEVLREWVQGLGKPKDDSHIPAWIRFSQPRRAKCRKGELIPKDWKSQFKRDLPTLKQNLRLKGEHMSTFGSFERYVPNFHSISMCGFVE